jgi:hypothetical protein
MYGYHHAFFWWFVEFSIAISVISEKSVKGEKRLEMGDECSIDG